MKPTAVDPRTTTRAAAEASEYAELVQ